MHSLRLNNNGVLIRQQLMIRRHCQCRSTVDRRQLKLKVTVCKSLVDVGPVLQFSPIQKVHYNPPSTHNFRTVDVEDVLEELIWIRLLPDGEMTTHCFLHLWHGYRSKDIEFLLYE